MASLNKPETPKPSSASQTPPRERIPAQPRPAPSPGVRPGAELAAEPPPPRVIIEDVAPAINGGQFPIKRTEGESVEVSADLFAEGHDIIRAALKFRPLGSAEWQEVPLFPGPNDRWSASFVCGPMGRYEYQVEAWVDRFETWRDGFRKKVDAGQDVSSELLEGTQILSSAASRANPADAQFLAARARALQAQTPLASRIESALDPVLHDIMKRYPDRSRASRSEPALPLWVERERARFGAWYELFPRSCADEPGRHGTFADLERRLPYIASLGFDIVYLPPIHPIGKTHRKGRNNTLTPGPEDVGSPWAIGSPEGGHTAIHPALGSLADFDHLVSSAAALNLEIALDIAFQCSPDHPWVAQHPEWFRKRPDGSIQYAENPPKKYQDIYPLDFETPAWKSLWNALRDVFLFWIDHGVTIFRVDNPHTKAFPFWEWVIPEVQKIEPRAIFLSEAFTRPKLMKRLAKGGYTQSYTYFTWRNDKHGLTEYLTELTRSECAQYMRPNFFANTPDILHEYLQIGGRPAFIIRLVLAATLSATYGIYGPPFELCIGTPLKPGSEEYLDSEKYEIRRWDLDSPTSIKHLIARVNMIRRAHRALQFNHTLRFCHADNDHILAYTKTAPEGGHAILTVVNLDPFHKQAGFVHLPMEEMGLPSGHHVTYQVTDLLNGPTYLWTGPRNYVELNPAHVPAHIFLVESTIKSERDFDYYH
jgi:starch synthase (maltosyl-transferring)